MNVDVIDVYMSGRECNIINVDMSGDSSDRECEHH